MKKHYRHENDCLNCGAGLQGHFCHVCGQENLQIKENFGHMMSHAISDYFHFDEKFFHTMKPLLFQPGKLTTDYMAGKRTQYLHPIRIYIFISLIFFLLYFSIGNDEKTTTHKTPAQKAHFVDSINNVLKKDGININYAKPKVITDPDDADLNLKVADFKATDTGKDTTYAQYLQNQQKLAPNKRDNFFGRLYKKKKYEWKSKGISQKDAVSEGFKHNFPKLMFILLPLFAFLLCLAFWKNHKFYVEHLIYAFNLHSFIFLFATFTILLNLIIPTNWGLAGWITGLSYIYTTWYIYKSLRILYQRSRWRTISKMIGLFFSYTLVFSFCAVIFLVVVAVYS